MIIMIDIWNKILSFFTFDRIISIISLILAIYGTFKTKKIANRERQAGRKPFRSRPFILAFILTIILIVIAVFIETESYLIAIIFACIYVENYCLYRRIEMQENLMDMIVLALKKMVPDNSIFLSKN